MLFLIILIYHSRMSVTDIDISVIEAYLYV